MIKYIGSKRVLLPHILDAVGGLSPSTTVLDLFSGTSRVGHALKAAGHRVIANDHNVYAWILARCYVQADAQAVRADALAALDHLRGLPPAPGWFTETYAVRSRFLHPDNAARVEAMREALAGMALSDDVFAVVLTALMEAADRVDSTVGVQMAYLKQWAPRALKPLELRLPDLLPAGAAGRCAAHCEDALDLAERVHADVAYLDPPYNQHKYLGNYHLWETLCRWDHPDVYGKACKRVDVRTRQSPFNRKHHALPALTDLIGRLRARHLVVSFSDEGFVSRGEMEALLRTRGEVHTLAIPHRRYVGSKIGIHDLSGRRVGTPGKDENREYIYVVRGHG
ncbi:MAG: DNA adenine methylase [Alphaproteobacteria bacterium]|nr:DNA adenine methylase [Alphaproteobacteria bacterium]